MGAVRLVLFPIAPKTLAGIDWELKVDCWRMTFRFSFSPGAWELNGVDCAGMFCSDSGIATDTPGEWATIGGLVIGGRPVNMNEIWRFQPMNSGRASGLAILQYWDVDLPDPRTQSGR